MMAGRKRSDARRNRDRILDAARRQFAETDEAVSMAAISRRAGVGMATLYRNFSDRKELLEAVYAAEADAVCEAAKNVHGTPPGLALRAWLRRFFAFAATKKHVAPELLARATRDRDRVVFADTRARVIAAGDVLFQAARLAHEVRSELSLPQVLDMLVAIAAVNGDPAYLSPMLETTLDGLGLPPDRGQD